MGLAFIIGLIVLGVFFMVIEIYLIPGISVAGIAGTACLIGGIVLAYMYYGTVTGTLILGGAGLLLAIVLYAFYKSKAFDKMALKTDIHSTTEPFRGLSVSIGDKGLTVSRLGPIGKVLINGVTIEGRAENELIDANTPVEVIEVGTYNVLVRKIEQQA